jgi:2'-5' RNA ligase
MRLKRYFEFMSILEDKSGTMYEYGCLMIYVKIPNWEQFIGDVDRETLYEPENERYGLETEPHATILYGIHKDVSDEQVLEMFSNIKKSDFDIYVDSIDCFYNKDYDVLKMNIKSNKLNELNKLATQLPHTSTYPDYKPHLTIGYFLKGMANKYVNLNFDMKINTIDKIVYSKTNGEKIDIPLE